MALVSPGVQVTIVDQSQYLPATANSVPLLILATAQNKSDPTSTNVAAGTTLANANKLYQVTSQRDLVTLFGNPFFYKTTNGTPIHGYELNEYGLLAAYSLLGVTNGCFILRADINLASLVGQISRPDGAPMDGTYWLDTLNTSWGIYQFNATTSSFTNIQPIVITNTSDLSAGKPKGSLGNVGSYAVVAIQPVNSDLQGGYNTYFYKTRFNTWVPVGSNAWKASIPAVTGTVSNPVLTAGDNFTITITPNTGTQVSSTPILVAVPASPNNNVSGLAAYINSAGITNVRAYNISGKLSLSLSSEGLSSEGLNSSITIGTGSGTVLNDLGIVPKSYCSPDLVYGTSAQMPLWSASQTNPHPTGSVWIKTSSAGNGLNLSLAQYSATIGSFSMIDVPLYVDERSANSDLDSTGGAAIPAGSIYAEYSDNYTHNSAPIVLWKRLATGPTVVTGTVSDPTITTGNVISVRTSLPGVPTYGSTYTITNSGTDAASFVSDWLAANIPYTTANITSDGAVQLVHTAGGEIYISDANGKTSTLMTSLGFVADVTTSVKNGPITFYTNAVANQSATSGSGSGVSFSVTAGAGRYIINTVGGGSGYAVGDSITLAGTQFLGASPANDLIVKVLAVSGGAVTKVGYASGTSVTNYYTQLSNWVMFDYTPSNGQPAALPADGTKWFYSSATTVDIMINQGGTWKGYKNVNYDSNGHPAISGVNATDPSGVICSAGAPTTQSDGTPLVYGDLWIDTSDLENYPMMYRWQSVSRVNQWVMIDKTDHVSSNGVIFADARWSTSGAVDPVNDPMPNIVSLLTSNYLDLDAPNPSLYPQGTLLFNTRVSGYNVKEFSASYFTGINFPNAGLYNDGDPTNIHDLPMMTYAWVSVSGLDNTGAAYMGRKAQRNIIVESLKAAIDTSATIREEDTFFNLIAAPGYPELQPNMVTLNNDRNNTAFIIGDTPLRLNDQATNITSWATNGATATSTGEDGWVTRDEYLGVFYPSGITTDLTGSPAVVPASHMMLRTFIRNDTVAYPWLAAAGTRRGTIDNATNIGYLDGTTGSFVTVKNRNSIRDVLYANQINPLAYFSGVGLLNYGNKGSFASSSAMDRINVARLVAYIRYQLQAAARPFIFEPNDSMTRTQITGVVQSLFIDLVAKRGLYDYLVVCDGSNNTSARIDRSELWIDIAIEPTKAAEFIYIPVRIVDTGILK